MKKAIALGVLLSASLVSFALAQSSAAGRVIEIVAGQPVTFDRNGEQIILHNLQKHLVSVEIDFDSQYLSGHISTVEYPPYTTGTYQMWISKTPGGDPLPGFEKITTTGLGGSFEFKHPSLKALGGRYATPGMFKYLDHGTYYYNLLPSDPTYSSVAHTLRTASMSSQEEAKAFDPSVTLANSAGIANTKNNSSACLALTKSLAKGSKDSLTGGEVTKVQNFLQGSHLSVAPTGYYGDLTVAAVKSFQKEYGISQVGIIGPQTRAKINELSCSGVAPVASKAVSEFTSVAKSVTVQPTYQVVGGIRVTGPFAGQTAQNDSSKVSITTITWEDNSSNKSDTVTIDLLDSGGNRVKTIASDTSNTGNYVWRYDPTLENGTYKISIRGANSSGQSSVFYIGAKTTATNPPNPPVTCPTGYTLVNGSCQSNQPVTPSTGKKYTPPYPDSGQRPSQEQIQAWEQSGYLPFYRKNFQNFSVMSFLNWKMKRENVTSRISGAAPDNEPYGSYIVDDAPQSCGQSQGFTELRERRVSLTAGGTYANGDGMWVSLKKNRAYSFKFVSPKSSGIIVRVNMGTYKAPQSTPIYWTISKSRCDFSYEKLDNMVDVCNGVEHPGWFQDGGARTIYIGMTPEGSVMDKAYCKLDPNQTYYFTFRVEDPRQVKSISERDAFYANLTNLTGFSSANPVKVAFYTPDTPQVQRTTARGLSVEQTLRRWLNAQPNMEEIVSKFGTEPYALVVSFDTMLSPFTMNKLNGGIIDPAKDTQRVMEYYQPGDNDIMFVDGE